VGFSGGKKKFTLSLILANTLIYLFVNLTLGDLYVLRFTQNNYLILVQGQWWRLFTANWFHANALHLISNMVALLIFGISLENSVQKGVYFAIYLISGLMGNIASLFLSDFYVESLGASGCVFGVLAASIVVNRRFDPVAVILGVVFAGLFVIMSFGPEIDTWAHLFGALGGIIFGAIFTPQAPEKRFKDVY